jgi:hypothetical protein
MDSKVLDIVPHANARTACSAHGEAAECSELVADVVLEDRGSGDINWAVCGRWLRQNEGAAAYLRDHPDKAAALGDY